MEKQVFNAYIDGFNLYKGSLERNPKLKWLNLITLCEALRSDMNLGKIYYFTANVKNRFPGDKSQNRQHAYLRVLSHQGIEVVFGKFRRDEKWLRFTHNEPRNLIDPRMPHYLGIPSKALTKVFELSKPDLPKAFVYWMEEKGSDVNLGSYLLRDCYRNQLEAALVITGDSDLATPIHFAVEQGTDVKVIVPGTAINVNDLKRVATSLSKLNIDLLLEHQLPKTFTTPSGRQIIRPDSWS